MGFTQAKKTCDKWFSKYIRQRDTLTGEVFLCCTCGKLKFYDQGECGHFISRGKLGTRWDERNAAFQCTHCNRWKNGMAAMMEPFINKKWGEGTTDELRQIASMGSKQRWNELGVRDISDKFRKLYNEVKEANKVELL